MTRYQIETKAVATMRKALSQGRRGAVVIHTTRARFFRAMNNFGLTAAQSSQAWQDVCDMAELDNLAEAA